MGIPSGFSIGWPKLAESEGIGPVGRGMLSVLSPPRFEVIISEDENEAGAKEVDPSVRAVVVVRGVDTGFNAPPFKVGWSTTLKEEFMGLNPGGMEGVDDTVDVVVAGTEGIGFGASALRVRLEIGFSSTTDFAMEEGGGMPNGKDGMGKVGGGTPGGILGNMEPRAGKGTGKDGMVGIVGMVGIMTYMALEEGGLGPTVSRFSSPDSSLI